MPAQLVSLCDGPSILLDKPILLVGRHPECDIQIDSRKISRRHCCIAQVSDFLVVRDLGSTNGIRINGVRVLEGRLKASDELTIGGNRYRVTWEVIPESSVNSAGKAPKEAAPGWIPTPIDPNDDDLLEDCEEPIPLAEPDDSPPVQPARKLAANLERANAGAISPPCLPAARPHSHIIPEELDLAPLSDMDMRSPQ